MNKLYLIANEFDDRGIHIYIYIYHVCIYMYICIRRHVQTRIIFYKERSMYPEQRCVNYIINYISLNSCIYIVMLILSVYIYVHLYMYILSV